MIKEGSVKVKGLLAVYLYEITNTYIYKLRNSREGHENIFKFLPKYTINKNDGANGKIALAKYYHQFIGWSDENEEKYLYFDIETLDGNLMEEIDSAGYDEFFEKTNFHDKVSVFKPQTVDNLLLSPPTPDYLIVETTYVTTIDHHSGGYECESSSEIVGYLDRELKPHYYGIRG